MFSLLAANLMLSYLLFSFKSRLAALKKTSVFKKQSNNTFSEIILLLFKFVNRPEMPLTE